MLVVDAAAGITPADRELIALFQAKQLPYLVAYNKADLMPDFPSQPDGLPVSALTGAGIEAFKGTSGRAGQNPGYHRPAGGATCCSRVIWPCWWSPSTSPRPRAA